MRTAWRKAAWCAAAVLTGAACSGKRGAVDGGDTREASAPGAPARAVVSGTVSYRSSAALPPDAEVCVTLEDAARVDAPGEVLAKQMLSTHGRQIPLPFELGYDPARIDPSRRYVVRAWLLRDGSQPLLGSTTYAAVLTGGAPSRVELTLQQIGGMEPGSAPPAEAPALIETTWKVVSIDGKAVLGEPGPNEPHLILRSQDSALVGSTGVNRMFGSYELTAGGAISLHPGGLTRMAGPEPLMAQEQRLLELLQQVDAYRLDGPQLALAAQGRDVIVLRAASGS